MSSEVRPIELREVKVGRYIVMDGVFALLKALLAALPESMGTQFRIEGEESLTERKGLLLKRWRKG